MEFHACWLKMQYLQPILIIFNAYLMTLTQILRNLVKRVYINNYSNIFLDDSARIGKYSQLIITEEQKEKNNVTRISLSNNVGVGRYNELQVWDGNQIILKEYSSLNDNCKILGDVTIEKYCTFSANIFASSGNHYVAIRPPWLVKDQDAFVLSTEQGREEHSKKIHFEEDCWIGYGAFIKQGVYIGRGAVVGAYTVVTKDVPPYSVQAGSPNKEIKKRVNFSPPVEIDFNNDAHLPYFYRGFCHRRIELEKSRKNTVILSEDEAIITLANSDDPKELCIQGKNLIFPNILNLSISLNGMYNWKININTAFIDLKLYLTEAINVEKEILYASIGAELKRYSIISLIAQPVNSPSAKYHFGITTIKLK